MTMSEGTEGIARILFPAPPEPVVVRATASTETLMRTMTLKLEFARTIVLG